MKRAAGILMPVFALPSKYGCGSLGRESYNFIDWLEKAGQSYWQMLPINHTGYGDSPYCCYSSFAGNPYFVDLEILADEGLFSISEIEAVKMEEDTLQIDYTILSEGRRQILGLALSRFDLNNQAYIDFINNEARWLNPYAEFMAAKENESLDYYKFIQYEFYKQWARLKAYANEKGIKLIGDIPVYVPYDSADVKAEPQFFQLDDMGNPKSVAGVPPDYFNEDGQLWGNPLYDWDKMKADGYGWWIRRMDGTLRMFDLVRIDHFRGFDTYWSVDAGETSAKNGHWEKGPGMDFVGVICNWFGKDRFIAEDLGELSDSVWDLLNASGLPGMKVLEFAFSKDMTSAYLPHYYNRNCICYTGTHDNAPILEWLSEEKEEVIDIACEYCNCNRDNIALGLIKAGMQSVADTFICQIQDWLGLGKDQRTNTPGIVGGNWKWRLPDGLLTDEKAAEIRDLTRLYGRI